MTSWSTPGHQKRPFLGATALALVAALLASGCGEGETPPFAPAPDTVAPVVQIVSPGSDTTYVRDGDLPGPPLIRGFATDTIGVVRAAYQLDGGPEVEVPISPGTSVAVIFRVVFHEGINELVLVAYDAAGNRAASAARHFRADNRGPEIRILGPDTAAVLDSATVHLAVHLSDPSGIQRLEYTLNSGGIAGRLVGDTVATLEIPFRLDLGTNIVQLTAFDENGTRSGATTYLRRGGVRFTDVSIGDNGFCALGTEGTVFCQSGSGRLAESGGDRRYLTVQVGNTNACALSTTGAVYCWLAPWRFRGFPGEGAPVEILAGTEFQALDAGPNRACAVSDSGALYCWSWDGWGAVSPPQLLAGGPYSSVSVGAVSNCALTASGRAFCWGNNSSGQLGTGNTEPASEPTPMATELRFSRVAMRGGHSCAVTLESAAYCWGNNQLGQLGTGEVSAAAEPVTTPVAVTGGIRLMAIDVGDGSTCGLTPDGVAYCWGDNLWAQLGTGDTRSHAAPTPVSGDLEWTKISSNAKGSCAISTDRRIYCWGGQVRSPQLQAGE